ncbi:MAG: class 1 isoprenoid biosynthesis enzyme [Candidatus Paceibacterota bacterium]
MMDVLFGDVSNLRQILECASQSLIGTYGNEHLLAEQFEAIPGRIICICPMVLCRAMLQDLGLEPNKDLLEGVGLSMYSISTHDDLVDEQPREREIVAALTYSRNIASLAGISHLVSNGHIGVARRIIELMNLNHQFQTAITCSLWTGPSDERQYLEAIRHTGYWASVGLVAAVVHAELEDLESFALHFGNLYGRMCQIYDDVREIDDDIRNGYFSLPISIALANGYNLEDLAERDKATLRSRQLAAEAFKESNVLCRSQFPALLNLAERMHRTGQNLFAT